jgi:hypothetical protein
MKGLENMIDSYGNELNKGDIILLTEITDPDGIKDAPYIVSDVWQDDLIVFLSLTDNTDRYVFQRHIAPSISDGLQYSIIKLHQINLQVVSNFSSGDFVKFFDNTQEFIGNIICSTINQKYFVIENIYNYQFVRRREDISILSEEEQFQYQMEQ